MFIKIVFLWTDFVASNIGLFWRERWSVWSEGECLQQIKFFLVAAAVFIISEAPPDAALGANWISVFTTISVITIMFMKVRAISWYKSFRWQLNIITVTIIITANKWSYILVGSLKIGGGILTTQSKSRNPIRLLLRCFWIWVLKIQDWAK